MGLTSSAVYDHAWGTEVVSFDAVKLCDQNSKKKERTTIAIGHGDMHLMAKLHHFHGDLKPNSNAGRKGKTVHYPSKAITHLTVMGKKLVSVSENRTLCIWSLADVYTEGQAPHSDAHNNKSRELNLGSCSCWSLDTIVAIDQVTRLCNCALVSLR